MLAKMVVNALIINVSCLTVLLLCIGQSSKIRAEEVDIRKMMALIRGEIMNSSVQYVLLQNERGNIVNISLKNTYNEGKSVRTSIGEIYFLLYTRKNIQEPEVLIKEDWNSVNNSHLGKTKPTKIIIHGWLNNRESPFCTMLKNAYLKSNDCNVIVVDWSKVAKNIMYLWVVSLTKSVGRYVGEFIKFLISNGIKAKNIHIIGHSLGAHVSGFSQEQLPELVARITGLDPAAPGFVLESLQLMGGHGRLSAEHANFVDVIHTCGGFLGLTKAIGHVDFYPNGGEKQPGCNQLNAESCSHSRAWKYFAESILGSPFRSKECSANQSSTTEVLMGQPTPITTRGKFCLKTWDKYPYGREGNIAGVYFENKNESHQWRFENPTWRSKAPSKPNPIIFLRYYYLLAFSIWC